MISEVIPGEGEVAARPPGGDAAEEAEAAARLTLFATRDGLHEALMKIFFAQTSLRDTMNACIRQKAQCVNDADLQQWLLACLNRKAQQLVEVTRFVKASIVVEG